MKRNFDLRSGELYQYDKIDGFRIYDPHSFKYKGFDIKSLYEHYIHKLKLLEIQNKYIDVFTKWCKENKIDIKKHDNLFELLEDFMKSALDQLFIIKDDEEYHHFELNRHGYVTKHTKLNGVIVNHKLVLPNDVDKGYYKLENKETKKDENKESELWILGF